MQSNKTIISSPELLSLSANLPSLDPTVFMPCRHDESQRRLSMRVYCLRDYSVVRFIYHGLIDPTILARLIDSRSNIVY